MFNETKKIMQHMDYIVYVSVQGSTGGCDQLSQVGGKFRTNSLRF